MKFKNAYDLIHGFKDHLFVQYPFDEAKTRWNQLQTAVTRYTIKGWGFHFTPDDTKLRKLNAELLKKAWSFLTTISVETFIHDGLNAQCKGFNYFDVSNKTKYTYRCALNKSIEFGKSAELGKSPEFGKSAESHCKPDCIPFKLRRGYGRVSDNPVIYRPFMGEYGLKESQLTEGLLSQLSELKKFRNQKYYPSRVEKAVRQSTIDTQNQSLLLIFGWRVNILGEDINSLSLETLIPALPLSASVQQLKEVQKYVESWLCDLMSFLHTERQIDSAATMMNFLFCLLALAKFHYLPFNDNDNYVQVPVIRFLRTRLNQLAKEKATQDSVADMSKKWMELPMFRDEVLEPLRLCCRRRKNCGDMRSLSAVAWSIQGYMMVGNLTYMPPRRQEELRDLRMAVSCPIKRPANLPVDGLIHPLPPDRYIGKNRFYGFLHRDESGVWYRDMTPESYKTGDIYGHQILEIPNIKFPDGYCFYDYIEMWLYGYYYAPNGELKANGAKFDPTASFVPRILETRSLCNPNHDFVFCQRNSRKFEATNLGKFFTNLSHSLTGIRVHPHLLRDIYATYYLDLGSSDALIRSLAYAMGHSVETLRKIYDRRRPAQKRQAIQKAVIDFFQQPWKDS